MSPKVFPVIHHLDVMTSVAQAAIAFANDVDGVFLISHNWMKEHELFEVLPIIREMYPLKFVGVNFLSYHAYEAFDRAAGAQFDAVWMDHAGVSSAGLTESGKDLQELRTAFISRMEVFASVAFKYQAVEPNPVKAAFLADSYGYIATTSGPATGHPPELDKIKAMSAATAGKLAIASGMTPENVHLFAPYLSHILVATGIAQDDHHIDKAKLIDFLAAARA